MRQERGGQGLRVAMNPRIHCSVYGAEGDGMKDYEIEEVVARHLVGELVEMPQCESEREVEDWFLERGFRVEWI